MIISLGDLYRLIDGRFNVGANAHIVAGAVMGAESGGNTDAISRSGDYGIFQINIIHFGDGIIDSGNWRNVEVQLSEMWKLSAGMTNWAAWCTMWADPARDCGHGFVNWPQAGSAAAGNLFAAQAEWTRYTGVGGGVGGTPLAPMPTSGRQQVGSAWGQVQNYAHHLAPAQWRTIDSIQRAMVRIRPR